MLTKRCAQWLCQLNRTKDKMQKISEEQRASPVCVYVFVHTHLCAFMAVCICKLTL